MSDRTAQRSDHEQTPEDTIAMLILAAGAPMEETWPELAVTVVPTRDSLKAKIAVVEGAAENATTARATLRRVRP